MKDDLSKIPERFSSEDGNINFSALFERAKEVGMEVNMDMIRYFDQHVGRQGNGFWISPENVVSFISKITSFLDPKSILDPACGSASFFLPINSLLNTDPYFLGVDINSEILKIAKFNLSNLNINYELLKGDFFLLKHNIDRKFDLIISQPPFGKIMHSNKEINGLKVRDMEIAFLLDSLDLLEVNGNLIFIIPENFFSSGYYKKIRSYLLDNFSIESIISLSSKTFFPYTGIKTNILILKNASQREKIFFAEYNENDDDVIISNFINGNSNDNLSQGFWVNFELLNKKNSLWTFNSLKALIEFKNKKSKSKYKLKQLSEIIKPLTNLKENDEVLLIPRILNKEIIFTNELENDSHLKNYYKFRITGKDILPQYLKIYLNSGIGKNQLNSISSGPGIKRVNKLGLGYVYIEIPDLKTQNEIIKTKQVSSEVYNKIKLLYGDFNNQVFNYSEILEIMETLQKKINEEKEEELFYRNLIWPFATSYHIAVKGSMDPNKRLDNYFNLFELISAFNAIVLLCSLPEELYKEEEDYIWNTQGSSYKKVTFGKWVALYSRLIGTYRKMLNFYKNKEGEDFYEFLPFDSEFYYPLLNTKLIKILNKVVEKRNMDAHGGAVPDILAENMISELNEYLNEIFPVLTAYGSLKLIYTEGMDKNRGIYTINSKILEGNSYSFDAYKIETDIDMDTKVLYLYNPVTDDRLMLCPELINLIQCEECGNWSLYFYNSLNGFNTHYISYQYEIHEHTDPREAIERFLNVIDPKDKDN